MVIKQLSLFVSIAKLCNRVTYMLMYILHNKHAFVIKYVVCQETLTLVEDRSRLTWDSPLGQADMTTFHSLFLILSESLSGMSVCLSLNWPVFTVID